MSIKITTYSMNFTFLDTHFMVSNKSISNKCTGQEQYQQ